MFNIVTSLPIEDLKIFLNQLKVNIGSFGIDISCLNVENSSITNISREQFTKWLNFKLVFNQE